LGIFIILLYAHNPPLLSGGGGVLSPFMENKVSSISYKQNTRTTKPK